MSHTNFPTTNAFPEPHAQGYTVQTADGKEAAATDWNPSWGWAAGAMISTLDDMRIWAPALATGKLLTPQMQAQRLQTVGAPGMPPQDGYGLGIFNLGGWIGHNGSLPGYQTVAVYLPEQETTLVILINTDIEYQGGEPSTTLATAITKELTPDHIYSLSERPETRCELTRHPTGQRKSCSNAGFGDGLHVGAGRQDLEPHRRRPQHRQVLAGGVRSRMARRRHRARAGRAFPRTRAAQRDRPGVLDHLPGHRVRARARVRLRRAVGDRAANTWHYRLTPVDGGTEVTESFRMNDSAFTKSSRCWAASYANGATSVTCARPSSGSKRSSRRPRVRDRVSS